jgi:hypothetical protein
MIVDEETKRRIIDLHSNERITIREIAKIVKKSSRDIIAVLKVSEKKENGEENIDIQGKNLPATKKEKGDTEYDLPLNIKAYKLLSERKSLVEVTINLKLTARQAQQFNSEYWKLIQMDHLFMIYQEIKNNLGYFLKLFRLGKKEGLTPENIINLLTMADNIQDLNEQFQFHQSKVKDMEIRKSLCKEQLEDLGNRTIIAKEQLSDTEKACKQKFGELTGICSQIQMLEYQIEHFKNSENYQSIEQITRCRVNEILADNNKPLEYVLVSVIEALRENPDRYFLIDKIPTMAILNHNPLGPIQSTFYQGNYQFVKEKVLDLADKIFHNLQKSIVDSALSTARRLEKGNPQSHLPRYLSHISMEDNMIEFDKGDIAP